MPTYDMDAVKAARMESRNEPLTVLFGGQIFTLPAEMPYAVIEATMRENAVTPAAILKLIMGAEQWQAFIACSPSLDDVGELFDIVNRAYGLTTGEALASSASSKSTTKRSRRTSSANTG